MLKTKKGANILRCRWGKPRGKSCLVRISLKSRRILDKVPDKFRRGFIDDAIYSASLLPVYAALCRGVQGGENSPLDNSDLKMR